MTDNNPPVSVDGSLIVVAAPSGAGKSSLLKELVASESSLHVAVSHTTRAMRPGERDGDHYHFVDVDSFKALVAEDAFVEYAQVFDNFYGTAKSSLEEPLKAGQDLILEIDWQGARQVKALYPDAFTIFIAPPSIDALRERLQNRGQDSEEVIERRMRDARAEMSHFDEFDYLVVNDDFDVALNELHCLVTTASLRREHQINRWPELLDSLL